MGSIVYISLVHDCICLFFVCKPLTCLPLEGGGVGDMLSPFSTSTAHTSHRSLKLRAYHISIHQELKPPDFVR